MRRLVILLALIFLMKCSGCEKVSKDWDYYSPNWTTDNKIVFIEQYGYQKYRKDIFGTWDLVEQRVENYLWEVDTNQNYRRIARLPDNTSGYYGLSSALEWVVFPVMNGGEVELWLIKRDGTGLHKLTNGKYPDFSPDARKIVFVRDDGLYVINRDGSNLRKIVSDSGANYPSWSSDNGRIAFVKGSATYPEEGNLVIVDTAGNFLKAYKTRIIAPDWGPPDSNAIVFNNWDYVCILYLDTGTVDTLKSIKSGASQIFWSLSGNLFIYFYFNWKVTNREGIVKFEIKP